jgi:proteasome assembly chaperone (PAC2) family protein
VSDTNRPGAEALRIVGPTDLRTPVVILAYAGWNDGGEAATTAAAHLLETFSAAKLASLDMEEFVDFTVVRPHVRPRDGGRREIRWPDHEFFAIRSETHAFDLIVGLGVEPHLRWRAFCAHVGELVARVGARLVILLGAFLDEVIYSQPIQVVGTSTDPQLSRDLGLAASRYEGPTGIVGVLAEMLAREGTPTLSLWARLPHYVQASPNSRAALALLQRVEAATGFPIDKTALETTAATFDQEVSEAIASDPHLSAYVRELKRRAFSQ